MRITFLFLSHLSKKGCNLLVFFRITMLGRSWVSLEFHWVLFSHWNWAYISRQREVLYNSLLRNCFFVPPYVNITTQFFIPILILFHQQQHISCSLSQEWFTLKVWNYIDDKGYINRGYLMYCSWIRSLFHEWEQIFEAIFSWVN